MPKELFNPQDVLETHFTEPGVSVESEADKAFTEQVRQCGSLEELYALLKSRTEGIPGTSRLYSSEEIRVRIERVRHGTANLQTITRTFGINEKVRQLLEADPTFGKK